jgi:hypothetical protein
MKRRNYSNDHIYSLIHLVTCERSKGGTYVCRRAKAKLISESQGDSQ